MRSRLPIFCFILTAIAVTSCADPAPTPSPNVSPSLSATEPTPQITASPQVTPPTVASSPSDGNQSGVSSLTGTVSDLDGALRDLGAKTINNQIVVELPADVLFDFDRADIRSDAIATLNKLLTIINAQPGNGPVRIEGYTDAVGNATYNQKLSEQRAASVKTWLTTSGITGSRLQARGFGAAKPRAANTKPDGSDNPKGRQQNRRVEVFVTKG